MDPTALFFTKLRKLAMTLETETGKLQQSFENRNNDGDSETMAKAMRAYHELNCDVMNVKAQVQDQLAQQKAKENEVSSFIKACRVMEKRVTDDIQGLKEHWEKYGYQAPRETQRPDRAKDQESEAEDEEADENENKSAGEEEESQEESEASHSSAGPPAPADLLRTPQLSDFGLSEMQLKRNLAGGEWCSEVPTMPELIFPKPSLNTLPTPPMPITPKCALRMDEDELQTPQMHDFGISEHTMCLNNDFTMDLFRKNVKKPERPPQDLPVPPVIESLQANGDYLNSPEPPVFCTPGFKIKKPNGHCTPSAQGNAAPESPGCPSNLPTTPEVPAFKTPYVNRLVSSKKSARQLEPIKMQVDDDSHTFELPTHNTAAGSKRKWEYDVPECSILGVEDKQMLEMPNLESVLGNSLQIRSAKKFSEYENVAKDPTVNHLELDRPTQQFILGTPRIRGDYLEPSTPERPDLSSVTQDICKLVSQAHLKKAAMEVVPPPVKPEKAKNSPLPTVVTVSPVSEGEFQSLPSYLRQMTLHNLNQAVHNINKFMVECRGGKTEFQMEELKRITSVGTKTPVYILCLIELNRLDHIGESAYKLNLHN